MNTTTQKESAIRPSAQAIEEARQMQLQFAPVIVNAVDVGKLSDLKQWFRKDECAKVFSVSTDTIQNWLDNGTLDGRLINSAIDKPERKHVRVTRESVVRLLNDGRRKIV